MVEFKTSLTKEEITDILKNHTLRPNFRNRRLPEALFCIFTKEGFHLVKSGPKGLIRGQSPFVATLEREGEHTLIKGVFSPIPGLRKSLGTIWIVGLGFLLYSQNFTILPLMMLILSACTVLSFLFVGQLAGRIDAVQQEDVINFISNTLVSDATNEREEHVER